VLATGPNFRVGSGCGSTGTRTMATALTTWKTRTIGNGRVLPPKTRHFKSTILAPIKYLSSDRIMTWSVCRLCSFNRSFTSCCQICHGTNIHCVAIENPPIWHTISRYFTAIVQILVRSHIWQREVKPRLRLHNLRTDHVMIQSELECFIAVEVAGTVKWNCGPGTTRPKNRGCMSRPGNNPAHTRQFRFLDRSGTELNQMADHNLDCW
jgi:hypothetical protein